MQTKMERIDAKVSDARKRLDKATIKRDDAIAALAKAADLIKMERRTLARLEHAKQELRNAERRARSSRKETTASEPMPSLTG